VGKPEGKNKLEDSGVWEDTIEMGLQEVGYGGMVWIILAEERGRWRALVNVVMNQQLLGTSQDQHLRVRRCSNYSARPVRQTDRQTRVCCKQMFIYSYHLRPLSIL